MVHTAVRTRIGRYGPLVVWMLFIYIASTGGFSSDNTSRILRPLLIWLFPQISEERIAALHFLMRKTAHFTEYAVLGFLAARAFIGSSHRVLREKWLHVSVLLVVAYALSDEFHQSFVSARTASIFDSLIDIAGGLFALICFAYFKRSKLQEIEWRIHSESDC